MKKYVRNYILFIPMIGAIAFLVTTLVLPPIITWLCVDTECSEGFSEEAWNKIEAGMSESEARAMIGEPLAEKPSAIDAEKTVLTYRTGTVLDWHVHDYLLVQDGRVVEKKEDAYKVYKNRDAPR